MGRVANRRLRVFSAERLGIWRELKVVWHSCSRVRSACELGLLGVYVGLGMLLRLLMRLGLRLGLDLLVFLVLFLFLFAVEVGAERHSEPVLEQDGAEWAAQWMERAVPR